MAKLYFVSNEIEILNNDRPFRKLERAEAYAAKAAEECSWRCLTPPGADNDRGNGNFMCGVMSPHGIHLRVEEDGRWTEELNFPEEEFQRSKGPGRHNDWALSVVIDRGTGYLADGEATFYFSGPEQTDTSWDQILDDLAGGDEVMEATVRLTPFGRYEHLTRYGVYPLVWKKGYGF